MAIESSVPAFLDALKVQLEARDNLAGVVVTTGWQGEDAGLESIQFQEIRSDTDWGLIGNGRINESFSVTGFVWIEKPGAGESAIKAARDRAYAILNEVIAQLRSDKQANGTVREAKLTSHEASQGTSAAGRRVCRITFTVSGEAYLTA